MLRVTAAPLDVQRIRADFPILSRRVNGHPLVNFYSTINANVHRGVHTLSVEATEAYEAARDRVGQFIGCDDPHEIVFVRNATEGLNLVATSWGRANLKPGDEVLATVLEHHSNLV